MDILLLIPPFILILIHGIGTIRKRKKINYFKKIFEKEITKTTISDIEEEMKENFSYFDKMKQDIINLKKNRRNILVGEIIFIAFLEGLLVDIYLMETSSIARDIFGVVCIVILTAAVCLGGYLLNN